MLQKSGFLPSVHGKRLVELTVRGVSGNNARVVVHSRVAINRTETLSGWGFGVQIAVQVSERNIKRLLGEVFPLNGKRLEMAVKSRLHLCHRCQARGYLKKDFLRTDHTKFEMEAAEVEEVVAKVESKTGSTTKAKRIAVMNEDISPATNSGDCASPKKKRSKRNFKRNKIIPSEDATNWKGQKKQIIDALKCKENIKS